MPYKTLLSIILLSYLSYAVQSQPLTQTIRGTVIDKILQKPIAGATISIVGLNKGDACDIDGNFIRVIDLKSKSKILAIPLNSISKSILEKYDYNLPSITNQKMNKYIVSP